jgi:2-polyprenyl-3-methyl-5-hydroxy-6-metoxy-1,4-benzoquinol methylase
LVYWLNFVLSLGVLLSQEELASMPVIVDPEGISAKIIQEFVDITGKRVLEIGCGKGRITMAIAERSSHITAIDPLAEDIQTAKQNTPASLKDKITFVASGIKDFNLPDDSAKFDIALFSWSL